MRGRSNAFVLFAAIIMVASAALYGCPKQPEVARGGPAMVGPGPSGSSSSAWVPPGAAGSKPGGEVPVVRPTAPTETPIAGVPAISSSPLPAGAAAAGGASPLKDIFFEYDRALIGDDQKAVLNENARWLKVNAAARIVIEGHCDERGSAEYNLGLGDRRAKAVRDYLILAGIAANRIGTISFGKERPFVVGHDENAWKQNRRVHFAVQSK